MEYHQIECKTVRQQSTGPTLVLPQAHASLYTFKHSTLTKAITKSFPQLVQTHHTENSCDQSVLCTQLHKSI